MKLDEVLTEIDSGAIKLGPNCMAHAQDVVQSVSKAVSAFYERKACSRTLASDNLTQDLLQDYKNNCKILDKNKTCADNSAQCNDINMITQSDCYVSALVTLVQGSDYEHVAECEVYDRAHTVFRKYFMETAGREYFNQLKNWATVICMNNDYYDDDDVDYSIGWKDQKAAGSNAEAVIQNLRKRMVGRLNRCFPVVYSNLFKTYMTSPPQTVVEDRYKMKDPKNFSTILKAEWTSKWARSNPLPTSLTPAGTPLPGESSAPGPTPSFFFYKLGTNGHLSKKLITGPVIHY
jgi:hypothetical protein